MPFRMFSLAETAEYLHISPDDLEELARRGECPCERQGKRLMFRHKDIDEWASRRLLGLPEKNIADFHQRSLDDARDLSPDAAILPSLLRPEWIATALACRSKPALLAEMADLADTTALVSDRDELLESLVEREKLCSTALPGGFALLHPRNHQPYMFFDPFIVAARSIAQIHFGAPDGQPTDLFFLICCPDDRIHLHVLARLCMMAHHTDLLPALREAPTPADFLDALLASEAQVLRQANA